MRKIIPLIILSMLILTPLLAEDVSASTVFLTSDNVNGHDADISQLNDIKNIIESKSNGDVTVIVDEYASNPGEGTRLMNAKCDVGVSIACACAGNLVDLADYSTKVDKKIIYVNAGDLDLNSLNFLRRSYDDDWSDASFASVKSPGKFLSDAGITLVQPIQVYPGDSYNGRISYDSNNVNELIANEILNQVYSQNTQNKQLDTDLIVYHKLDPMYLAEDSKKIADSYGGDMQDAYGSYTTQQLLYMSSSYLVGYGLDVPPSFEAPDNPEKYSRFTKGEYSFNDYWNMADIVVDYMNEHGKAPDSINYNGATIGYYDLVYNFALLTENHSSASNMAFPSEFGFHKYYDNFLMEILPIVVLFAIILGIIIIVRKILKGRKRKKEMKRRNRERKANSNKKSRVFHKNIDAQYFSDYGSDQPRRLNRPKRRR